MKPQNIEDVLVSLHSGQWFGWSDPTNKIYENLIIHSEDAKPTKEWLEAEVARLQTEYALADMRTKRDRLLSESDWTQNRDVTLSNDSDWATYRQALRDLPSGKTTKAHVDAATWPTKP